VANIDSTAQTSIDGNPVTVSTTGGSQVAVVAFDGVAGQKVNISLSNSTYTGCTAAVVTLREPNGTSLASTSLCDPNAVIQWQVLPVSGTYTVIVSSANAGSMAVAVYNTIIQRSYGSTSNGTNVAPAFLANATVGNLVIVVVGLSGAGKDPTPSVTSVTGFGITWSNTAMSAIGSGKTLASVQIWCGIVVTAGTTVTINTSGIANIEVAMAEYTGYPATLDGTPVGANGNSSTFSTGNLATTNAHDLLVAGFALNIGLSAVNPSNAFII
jgi:hypothetical protein